jgi:hypothetical protein
MPALNQVFHLHEATTGLDIMETFKAQRLGLKQTKIPPATNIGTIGSPVYVYSGIIAQNFRDAFNLDYNATGLFDVIFIGGSTTGLGQVVITANFPGAVFEDTNTLSGVEVTILNVEASTPINIETVEITQADTNPCQNVNAVVTTDVLATKVTTVDGILIEPNIDNPFTIIGLRGSTLDITVESVDGNTDKETIVFPSVLSESNFTLNIVGSPNGSNVSVTNVNTFGLELQYSLDGTTWQDSNVFSGLMADDYTMYVKDNLGCSFEKDFTITDSNIYIPSFYISKSNSIRYAQRIDWGDAANYKNDENTLSCEVDALQKFKQIQLFQSADIVTTQFKSNYATNIAKVVRTGFADIDVPVVKKTNNIGLKDMRDARMYNLGDNTTGIYFLAGNTYDYNTMAVNGSHALNGLLPEWGVIGNYVNIDSAWFIIENVIFDETKNADVLVINQIYTGSETSIVIGCIYNAFEYEVYEFEIDMSDYLDQNIRVKILNEDPNFQTIEHLSEEINVAVRQEDTLDIHYWNPTNNDVFYETGIKHRIRMPYYKIEGQPDEDSSIHKTDATAILLSAQLYEGDKFVFEPTTKELWRKLMAALSHKFVFINGVQYVKNGDFETDGPLEDSNLYVLKVNMTKAGTVYNSDGSTFGMGNSSQVEIPGLLEGDNGFLSY